MVDGIGVHPEFLGGARPVEFVVDVPGQGVEQFGLRGERVQDREEPVAGQTGSGHLILHDEVAESPESGAVPGGTGKEIVDGMLSSGDVGHFDAGGRLFIDGRDDDMIVSGGENVYPLEVENLLAERPDVAEAAVVGVDDRDFGKRLRAYVVRLGGATCDEQEIKAYVKTHLARHKVPREVVFLDELPRNATGKLLRRMLEQPDLG